MSRVGRTEARLHQKARRLVCGRRRCRCRRGADGGAAGGRRRRSRTTSRRRRPTRRVPRRRPARPYAPCVSIQTHRALPCSSLGGRPSERGVGRAPKHLYKEKRGVTAASRRSSARSDSRHGRLKPDDAMPKSRVARIREGNAPSVSLRPLRKCLDEPAKSPAMHEWKTPYGLPPFGAGPRRAFRAGLRRGARSAQRRDRAPRVAGRAAVVRQHRGGVRCQRTSAGAHQPAVSQPVQFRDLGRTAGGRARDGAAAGRAPECDLPERRAVRADRRAACAA